MSIVSNYDIDNASGQTVRLDIQACLKALQSSNSSSADSDLSSSACVAGMLFLNSTSDELKVRNSSNGAFTTIGNIDQVNLGLLSKSGGTMTGQFLADDSNSASAPAIAFDTDADTGLFRKSANIMGFASGGTERLFLDANGITLQSQNDLRFADNDSSHYVGFQAPATISSSLVWTLPSADATVSGYALVSDASGKLSWAAAGAGAQGA